MAEGTVIHVREADRAQGVFTNHSDDGGVRLLLPSDLFFLFFMMRAA